MSIARKASSLALALSFLLIAVPGRSGEVSLPLKAEKDSPGGSGTATLDEGKIRIRAEGLRPDSVYTVWFVNMKPRKHEAGAGTAPYMFRSDGQGKGSYESPLSGSPFGKWGTIMVVRHTTGDPGDMKNMAPALSAGIPGKQQMTRRGGGTSHSAPFSGFAGQPLLRDRSGIPLKAKR